MDIMGYRPETLAPGHIYHVYNRGVNRALITVDDNDRQRMVDLLAYYLPRGHVGSYSFIMRGKRSVERNQQIMKQWPQRGHGWVDLLSFCLMDNHIHLLLHENVEHGISTYIQRIFTSYAKYFNTRHHREGPLFSGRFRAVRTQNDDQFLHITRYIHLNPYVAGMIDNPFSYHWSSLREYDNSTQQRFCHTNLLKDMMKSDEYRNFVTDYADYARELENIKHLVLDKE